MTTAPGKPTVRALRERLHVRQNLAYGKTGRGYILQLSIYVGLATPSRDETPLVARALVAKSAGGINFGSKMSADIHCT